MSTSTKQKETDFVGPTGPTHGGGDINTSVVSPTYDQVGDRTEEEALNAISPLNEKSMNESTNDTDQCSEESDSDGEDDVDDYSSPPYGIRRSSSVIFRPTPTPHANFGLMKCPDSRDLICRDGRVKPLRPPSKVETACEELRRIVDLEECEKPTRDLKSIVGCTNAVAELKLNFVLPFQYPTLFGMTRMPCTCVLLYGPYGSGKRAIAKSLAGERNGTFVSIHAASLLAASYDKLDNMIGALFDFAAQVLPAVIYIQDIDVLFTVSEEVTRSTNRILFILAAHKARFELKTRPGDFIVIAGSVCQLNDINAYATKVFQKSIEVGLPETFDRNMLLKKFLMNSQHSLTDGDFEKLAEETSGMTVGGIESAMREAQLIPVQKMCCATHFRKIELVIDNATGCTGYWTPCEGSDSGAVEMKYGDIRRKEEILVSPVTLEMVHDSVMKFVSMAKSSKPTFKRSGRYLHRYILMETITASPNPSLECLVSALEEKQAGEGREEPVPPPLIRPPTRKAWYEVFLDCFF